jgi:hypothetical protein
LRGQAREFGGADFIEDNLHDWGVHEGIQARVQERMWMPRIDVRKDKRRNLVRI